MSRRSITVYHPMNMYWTETVFEGEYVSYSVSDGILTIQDWKNENAHGSASFPAGGWSYVVIAIENTKLTSGADGADPV